MHMMPFVFKDCDGAYLLMLDISCLVKLSWNAWKGDNQVSTGGRVKYVERGKLPLLSVK